MSYIGNSPGVASQRVTTTLTATAGQTQFTTQSGYVLGYVDVYLNGAKLVNGSDFEAITGTYITLFAGASAGDVVELISYVPRGLSDGYTKAEADAKFLDVGGDTASGNLAFATASLTGNLTLSGGTANGVGYLNASKVVTTGSALTFDGTFLKLGTTSSTNKLLIDTAVSNAGNIQLPRGGYIGFSNAADTANSEYVFANAGNLELGVDGSSRVYVSSTGNVGVGGTSVTLKSKRTLQVLGFAKLGDDNGNGLLSLGDIASTGANVAVWRGAGGPYAGVGNYLNLGGYDGITFTTGNNSIDSQTERLRILSDGNISVGSTVSRQKLHVKGRFNSDLNDDYYGLWGEGNTAASGYSFLAVGDWYTTSLYIQKQTGSSFAHIYNHNSTHNIVLQAGSGDNGTTSASGNVYIGTTTTNTNSSKLVVNGTISQTVGGNQYLVVDQSDVGTAPNQIPLNQYLGSMAFQDRENVNFLGGTGALNSLDISAISAQLNVAAVDIFVYDTSKDSDGGAWRKRCQHTSWYNETLNTAVRGARREFPAVAVIVCTTNTMTIHDGDDPTLPMWMVFSPGGILDWPTTTHTRLIANALNGGIVVVSEDGGQWFRFIDDTTHIIYMSLTYNITSDKSIANRNGPSAYNSSGAAVNTYAVAGYAYNDVAVTVLPNAPIDSATGLPTPTIAIAGANGLSLIQNTGTVYTYAPSGSTIQKVSFGPDGSLWMTTPHVSGVVGYRLYYYKPATVATGSISSPTSVYGHATGIALNVSGGEVPGGGGYFNSVELTAPNEVSFASIGATSAGQTLVKLSHNTTNPSSSLVAFIKTKYNTGWMVGDIKGAWLSDTTTEVLNGINLVSNGTFDSNVTGWTAVGSGSSISWNAAGRINVVTGTEQWGGAYTTVQVVAGRTYVITGDIISNGGGWAGISGSYEGGSSGVKVFNGAYPAAQSWSFTHTATQTGTLYITIDHSNTTPSITIVADNISCRIADPDRSINKKALETVGNIIKTPVAAGADLVAYSGFTTNNYLQQPYNSALDFGTGDFSYMGWYNGVDTGTGVTVLFSRGTSTVAGSILVQKEGTSNIYLYLSTGTQWQNVYVSNSTLPLFGWHHLTITRYNGTISIYIDGVKFTTSTTVGSQASTLTLASPYGLRFGARFDSSDAGGGASMALWKASATSPSADQVMKIYQDEKVLFQENAKATLYGASDVPTALAYDEDTKRLHVGTSSGRSVFQGLRRVDNTTIAVTSAISAVDGLVAEN